MAKANRKSRGAVIGFLERIERIITRPVRSLLFDLGSNPFNPLLESVDSFLSATKPPTHLDGQPFSRTRLKNGCCLVRDEAATVCAPRYHPAWPAALAPSFRRRPGSSPAIGCPANGGLPEQASRGGKLGIGRLGNWQSGKRLTNLPIYQFTNLPTYQLTNPVHLSARERTSAGFHREGLPVTAPPPWRLPPAYSSPSQPLECVNYLISPSRRVRTCGSLPAILSPSLILQPQMLKVTVTCKARG